MYILYSIPYVLYIYTIMYYTIDIYIYIYISLYGLFPLVIRIIQRSDILWLYFTYPDNEWAKKYLHG